MSTYEFSVEQRAIPGANEHGWVAVNDADGAEISLQKGGSGQFLGRYPEIEDYLAGKGIKAALSYTPRRGDKLDLDYEQEVFTWTFNTGGEIVVRDIPRLIASLTIEL